MPVMRRARQAVRRMSTPLLVLAFCFGCEPVRASSRTTVLTATEARILVYLCPVSAAEREHGFDVAMERQTSPKLNQSDYYYFWVYNAKRPQTSGSVTVGYYAVNKHTGQIWDTDSKKEISSPLIRGVQAIIRRSHQIGGAAMEEYAQKPF